VWISRTGTDIAEAGRKGARQVISEPHETVGVILAGGLGRRIGGRKAGRLLAGRSLLAHVLDRLAPQFPPGRLVLNANDMDPEFRQFGLPIVPDTVAGRPGPLAGLLAAMQLAERRHQDIRWVLSAPTDTPFLPCNLLVALTRRQRESNADIVLSDSEAGLAHLCGLWSVGLATPLAHALAIGQNRVLDFVSRPAVASVRFPLQQIGRHTVDPFFNVNTLDDLAAAEHILKRET